MASLALMVSLIVVFIIFSGPTIFLLSKINRIHNNIIYLLGIITIFCGLWFFCLPIPAIRYAGLFSAILAVCAMAERKNKTKG